MATATATTTPGAPPCASHALNGRPPSFCGRGAPTRPRGTELGLSRMAILEPHFPSFTRGRVVASIRARAAPTSRTISSQQYPPEPPRLPRARQAHVRLSRCCNVPTGTGECIVPDTGTARVKESCGLISGLRAHAALACRCSRAWPSVPACSTASRDSLFKSLAATLTLREPLSALSRTT